jgi:hypothetical protein
MRVELNYLLVFLKSTSLPLSIFIIKVQFTCHKIHHFKVCNLIAFRFIELSNHHCYQLLNIFITPENIAYPLALTLHFPPSPLQSDIGSHLSIFCFYRLFPSLTFQINGDKQMWPLLLVLFT